MQANCVYNNSNESVEDEQTRMIMRYCQQMENYKGAICGLIDYVNTLDIVPLKVQMQIPFIKKYVNDDENDEELLENGVLYLLENKEIILNFNFDNIIDFGQQYKNTNIQNKFIDMIDEFIKTIQKNKKKISKKNIKLIKEIFEHIFDILEDIKNILS